MSDLVLYNDELITFQNPNGVSVYQMSGELELIGSAIRRPHHEIVDQNVATVPPRQSYTVEWYNSNIYEDYVNIYALKVNYCGLERNIGPYGSSGTGRRVVPSGWWDTYEDYTGKVKEGSYFNLRYNDSANFHFDLNWSAVVIPCDAAVTYGTYAYMYRCSDFIHKSGSTASRIYTARATNSSGYVYQGGWNIPLGPSSFSMEYNANTVLTNTNRQWQEEQQDFNSNAVYLSAFENYQDVRMPIYVYQIFGASNSYSYERYSEMTASGGTSRDYSYSALKMWPGQWSGTISAIDVPEFIRY